MVNIPSAGQLRTLAEYEPVAMPDHALAAAVFRYPLSSPQESRLVIE